MRARSSTVTRSLDGHFGGGAAAGAGVEDLGVVVNVHVAGGGDGGGEESAFDAEVGGGEDGGVGGIDGGAEGSAAGTQDGAGQPHADILRDGSIGDAEGSGEIAADD